MTNENIAIVIPVYCPEDSTTQVIESALRDFYHVIVVNDGSPSTFDQFFESLDSRVLVIHHDVNLGKGAAIKSALKYVAELNIKGAITVDADGQHLHNDVLNVSFFAESSPESFVLGVRDFSESIPFRSKFGNGLTLAVLKLFYGLSLSDSQTGLRYIPRWMFDDFLSLPGERYEFELQCLLHAQKISAVIAQVPISTVYIEGNSSSHFRPIRDSLKIYAVFVKYSISSLTCFALDIAIFSLIFALSGNVWASTVCSRVISGASNFAINRHIVFGAAKSSSILSAAIKYVCLWVFTLVVSASFVDLLSEDGDIAFVVPIKLLIDAVLFILNYKIQKNYVFK